MRNNKIKVIKRINTGESEQKKAVPDLPKSESKIRHKLSKVVNDWISERRENSRMERLFSESNILAWQIAVPKVIKNTG